MARHAEYTCLRRAGTWFLYSSDGGTEKTGGRIGRCRGGHTPAAIRDLTTKSSAPEKVVTWKTATATCVPTARMANRLGGDRAITNATAFRATTCQRLRIASFTL